jgi:hypothetical protein
MKILHCSTWATASALRSACDDKAAACRQGRCLSLAALLIAGVLGGPAHAAATETSYGGFLLAPYIQMGAGQSRLSSTANTGTAMNLAGTANGFGKRLAVGARFNAWLGTELTWFNIAPSTVNTAVGAATYRGNDVALSATALVSLSPRFSIVARAGVGRSDMKVSVPAVSYTSTSRKNARLVGIGARFALSPQLDLTVDFDSLGKVGKYALGDSVRPTVFTAGLRFNF